MSSIFSTQKRQTFLRRKYCFLVASALSPPVGRIEPLMGRPPRCSAMLLSYLFRHWGRWSHSDWSAGHRGSGPGTNGLSRSRHHMLDRQAGRSRRRRFTGGTLLALLLALLDLLQFFVDAHALEFHHQIGYAQAALHFEHRLRLGGEL